jgi:DeoR family transcriptional regulator of aga operon
VIKNLTFSHRHDNIKRKQSSNTFPSLKGSMNEYQKIIFAELIRNESSDIERLAKLLDVSDSTVRRQLSDMEKNGIIVRIPGGAKLTTPITYKLLYENRAAQAIDAKRQIAAEAISLVSPNSVIGISGGTTCTWLARQLQLVEDLTVVTNAINVALEIHSQSSKRIVVTGGLLNQNSYELVGNQVTQSLQNVHLDIAFLGVSRIDADFGFSMSDEPEAVIGRSFMSCANRTVILADHTKIGGSSFARLCSINEINLLITDDHIPPEALESLQKAGLKVLVASPDSGIHPS